MENKILSKYIIALITCLLFTSCEYEYSWIENIIFDYRYPRINQNGHFSMTETIRGSRINEVDQSKQNIVSIIAEDSWIEVTSAGLMKANDTIKIDYIAVNKDTLWLGYEQIIDKDATGRIYFDKDTAYQSFMQKSLNILADEGYIKATVGGYINCRTPNLYITLSNYIDIYVKQ